MNIYKDFVFDDRLISPINGYTCKRITTQNIKQFGLDSKEQLLEKYPDFPFMCKQFSYNVRNSLKSSKIFAEKQEEIRRDFLYKKQLEILEYNKNPILCVCCKKHINYERRSNNFCSVSCSNKVRKHSIETKMKISNSVKRNPSGIVIMSKEKQKLILEDVYKE